MNFKMFESKMNEGASYAPDDEVLIKYWATGELVPVKIVKLDKGMAHVSFKIEGSAYPEAPDTDIKTSDIVSIYKANNEPAIGGQNVIKRTVTKISNDFVINNYPKQI